MDDTDDSQRRIELASDKDLAFLIANVRAAAAEHLHAAFPPQNRDSSGEDKLRDEIEAIVDDYIDRTFTLAAPNLSINGLPVNAADFFPPARSRGGGRKSSLPPPADVAYEPFDADKRQRVADLVSAEERLLEEVAAMKRAVPADVAARVAAKLDEAAARDDEQLQRGLDAAAAAARRCSENDDDDDGRVLVSPLERQEGVEERFRGAVAAMGRLQRDMPSVVAKMERARVAGEYVRDER
ncbi:Kinetochore Mis14 [Cordyceps fumosorosea ARSEF 2679]|uniref:Kinetochore Mis14 n=1 Tax=Cordyceps fumosorosea (strain ARSEF 2679) TaxID=1081104 RepID=A0A162IA09_CORFA|nr:Kinetochore Mis14 [Cordyceps fumosorosea ARSEF 2679]OAA54235.1 Kinetochore Mis14 [Cordyceps fumosorosea ARSEF 2679]